jgi:transposase
MRCGCTANLNGRGKPYTHITPDVADILLFKRRSPRATHKLLDIWLDDATSSGIHGMRQFAIMMRRDIAAMRDAICEPWSNGQVGGQINRLKKVKRFMYGRAGLDLLRIRMLPFHRRSDHRD